MADDRPLIEWHVHIGNWTGICRQRLVAHVINYQDSWADPPYWYWAVILPGNSDPPWISEKLPGRWDTAEEAKEVVEDLLGDELAGWYDGS